MGKVYRTEIDNGILVCYPVIKKFAYFPVKTRDVGFVWFSTYYQTVSEFKSSTVRSNYSNLENTPFMFKL